MTDVTVEATNTALPAHTRPVFFSANELLLELLHIAQNFANVDLESLLIFLCANDATMRPFMLSDSDAPLPITEKVDETLRGSISRRMIADKTGLPRETVRRKADELVSVGLLLVDAEGRLRTTSLLGDPSAQAHVDALHAAVMRYQKRMEQFRVRFDRRGPDLGEA